MLLLFKIFKLNFLSPKQWVLLKKSFFHNYLATLFPRSGNPISSYSFLNDTIQFLVAQNMGIATITI